MNHALKSIVGVVACASTATAVSSFLAGAGEIRMAGPFVCFLLVIVTAMLVGRLAAALGALCAAIVLAIWLFPPTGSIAIEEPEARIVLLAFLLLSASVTLVPKFEATRPFQNRTRRVGHCFRTSGCTSSNAFPHIPHATFNRLVNGPHTAQRIPLSADGASDKDKSQTTSMGRRVRRR